VRRHPCPLDPVQDPGVEVEAEKPDKDVAEHRRCIPEVEFIRLDQTLERSKMVLDQVSRLIYLVDLLGLRLHRGEDQNPAGTLQPLV